MLTTRALGNGRAIQLDAQRNTLALASLGIENRLLPTGALGNGRAIGLGVLVGHALALAGLVVEDRLLPTGTLGDGGTILDAGIEVGEKLASATVPVDVDVM